MSENKIQEDKVYEDLKKAMEFVKTSRFVTDIIGKGRNVGGAWFSQRLNRKTRHNGTTLFRFNNSDLRLVMVALRVVITKLQRAVDSIDDYLIEQKKHERNS